MKVSIITVTFNSGSTLRDTLESVCSQSYHDIEHIIVDGSSTDNTLNIANEYSHISLIVSEKDKGIYDAMNKGISLSTGEIVGILNSDDLYQDTYIIETIVNLFSQYSSTDIVYGNLIYVKSENVDKVVRRWKSMPYKNDFFDNGNVPPHPSLFVKRRIYEESGLFNLDFKLAADYEFMLRIFKKHSYKSKYVNTVFVKMRTGGATNKSFSNIVKQNIEILNSWNHNQLKLPFLLMPLRIIKRLIQYI